jgi:hypothetical protein
VAFTALLDALVIALAALLPRPNLGDASVVLGCTGISSPIGMTVISRRARPKGRQIWDLAILPVLGVQSDETSVRKALPPVGLASVAVTPLGVFSVTCFTDVRGGIP